jgi:hypothetical protein
MIQSGCTELHRQKRLTPATRKAHTASEPSRKKRTPCAPAALSIHRDKRKSFSIKHLYLMCSTIERRGGID